MSIIWTDIETTGLERDKHTLFEIALVAHDSGDRHVFWFDLTPEELRNADPGAIKVNRYYTRLHERDEQDLGGSDLEESAETVARLLMNNTIGGNNPSFDAGFLEVWLRKNGHCPAWHHYPLCAPTVGATVLGMKPPFRAADVAKGLGVSQPANAHEALADALYSQAIYNAAMKRQEALRSTEWKAFGGAVVEDGKIVEGAESLKRERERKG